MNRAFVNKVITISAGLGLLVALPKSPVAAQSTLDRLAVPLEEAASRVQPAPLSRVVLSGDHSISNSALSAVKITGLVPNNGGRFNIQTKSGYQCTLAIIPSQESGTLISIFGGSNSRPFYSKNVTKPTLLRLPVTRSESDFLVLRTKTDAGHTPAQITATAKPVSAVSNTKQEGVRVEGPVVNSDGTQIGTINIE